MRKFVTGIGALVGLFKPKPGRGAADGDPDDAVDEEWDDDEDIDTLEALEEVTRIGGQGLSPEEMRDNYWRDHGHPPFMNPVHDDDPQEW